MSDEQKEAKRVADLDAKIEEAGRGHSPNVILAGKARPATVSGEANIGMEHTVMLPSEEMQRRGWYAENANILIEQFRGRYKELRAREQATSTEGGQ
jgi:hypothetical protein